MTISNHIATGALIAFAIKQPYLAIPLAFASHFALDALPHHGVANISSFAKLLRKPSFIIMESLDLIGIILLFALLQNHPYIVIVGLVAASPDSVWFYRLFKHRGDFETKKNWMTNFHARIQWGEREWGIVVEIIYFVFLYTTLSRLIRI